MVTVADSWKNARATQQTNKRITIFRSTGKTLTFHDPEIYKLANILKHEYEFQIREFNGGTLTPDISEVGSGA
jgi:Fe2+ or Zn2+ uptake regulation protein